MKRVETKSKLDEHRSEVAPARSRVLLTWGLLLGWLALMSFGAVSALDPPWLQDLTRGGRVMEARDCKTAGDAQLHQGLYSLAAAQYVEALRIQPDNLGARVNLAIAYSKAGLAEKAIATLEEALAQADGMTRTGVIHVNLADLYREQGHTAEAIEHYQLAIGDDVEQDLVYRKLGTLHLVEQRLEPALAAFQKALECQCDVRLTYRYMLRRNLEKFADHPEQRTAIERQLEQIDTVELTPYDLEIVRQVQRSDRNIAKTHNHLGLIHYRLGHRDEAIAHFESSLEIWPGNTDATRYLQALRQSKP